MNLSKTEKLLAAKKKLKEFQLSKMVHENVSYEQNHVPKPPVAQCQSKEIKRTEALQESTEKVMENNQNCTINSNHYSVVNNLSTIPIETNANNVENTNLLESNNVKYSNHSHEINLDARDSVERTVKHEEISTTMGQVDFPTQKEHLLEMTSQVVDILANNSDPAEQMNEVVEPELTYRDQFVNSYLEEQKKLVNNLHLEMNTYRSRIAELERHLATRDMEFQAQLAREVNPLREQLQAHTQTTGILIAEKAELTAALAQAQQSVRQTKEETEELSTKLRNAQSQITELEKETAALKANNEEVRKNSLQLRNDYESLEQQLFELRKEKEELGLESSELKQKLNLKKTELISTQQELQEKTALLSLSELRIQQMKDAAPSEDDGQGLLALQQDLNAAKEIINALNEEKKEAHKQYQDYIRQLDTRHSKLLSEMQTQSKTIEDFEAREQSYVQRLSDLEQQLQQEREKTKALLPLQNRKQEMDNLMKNIDELTLENERLHITVAEKDTQIESLTKEVSELQEVTSQSVEVSKLANALESEQLGASRAVSQNQQLKQQLTEMENAFVSLSNAKLDLTEQLQAERSVGKKLNAMLNKIESETEELKDKLKEKETVLAELEKEKLQNLQIADQMQHYHAQSHHVHTFQTELQNALARIEELEKDKQELLKKLKAHEDRQVPIESDLSPTDENAAATEPESHAPLITMEETSSLCNSVTEPVKKLEERFKETMERVAELTEEKQRLEHLVMQLQSETETIGEYITLYQKQRAILQSRALEREATFKQLLEQRNQQQEQLHKMKVLLSSFLVKQDTTPEVFKTTDANSKEVTENNVTTKLAEEVASVPGEVSKSEDKGLSELLDLLAEIKDCQDSCVFDTNFHPCPWCSGKLITV